MHLDTKQARYAHFDLSLDNQIWWIERIQNTGPRIAPYDLGIK